MRRATAIVRIVYSSDPDCTCERVQDSLGHPRLHLACTNGRRPPAAARRRRDSADCTAPIGISRILLYVFTAVCWYRVSWQGSGRGWLGETRNIQRSRGYCKSFYACAEIRTAYSQSCWGVVMSAAVCPVLPSPGPLPCPVA